MRSFRVTAASAAALLATFAIPATAQDPPTPAPPADQLPPVDVIQKQPTPAPKAAKKTVAKKKSVSPAPQPPPAAVAEPDPETVNPNSVYGSPASAGAAARAFQGAASPVNPQQIIPTDLQGYSSSATHITSENITERQPRTINEALTRVPGVIVVNDDGNAHHGGIGLRGSPPRRSRKLLVMEDGHPANMALWLDPSVHYWAPMDRIESIEVIRGTVINHGPNNNFGVLNARNLSPFGPNETTISSAIGFTRSKGGKFTPVDDIDATNVDANGNVIIPFEDDEAVHGKSDTDISARWHVHTRQSVDNVGLVASYTGADVQGNWDTERLRFNDFYGALGWKGNTSDVVITAMHARQRDDYDEQNFLGSYEVQNAGSEQEARDIAAGLAERQFFDLAHCKSCFAPGSGLNTYTGEVWRSQVVHNAYLDENTTVTSRFYAGWHRRDRYQLIGTNAFDPTLPARPAGEAPEVDEAGGEITFGRDTMFGRLRTYRHLGAEVRGEWANQYAFGFKQDFQAGIRYEYQDMTNKNVLGLSGQVLEDGDKGVATFFDRSLEANTVSAFLQTNIYVASDFNVLPGIRFEWFDITRQNRVVADEEGEAEQQGGGVCGATPFGAQCRRIEDLNFDPTPEDGTSSFVALPGVAFAYTGLYRTTVYGGYHRGLTTAVLRNENLPAPDEIGDNFNVGLRSSSIMGFDFEVAGFYHFMHDFQYGESFASVGGDREFGRANEVEIRGVELYGRLNSQPFTGGPLNFFTEGNYTYSQGRFTDAPRFDDDGNVVGSFNGNRIPEVPWHIAALTVGVEGTTGWRWNASATYTYRGAFFTDAANTPFGRAFEVNDEGGGEFEIEEAGEAGQVPSIWLLSARFNLDIGNSGASVFVAGDNLLDELYITDREDGMKPGLGRTIWTGFKYTF